MIKYLVLLINLIGLFIYQLFMQSAVTVTQTAPSSAQPGTTFTVEVTINKGAASGFAKYQANLPQGFTATAVDKAGATVLASGNAIKYIWASLPGDATMKISYTVSVDPSITGNQSIDGTFLYVQDNQKVPVNANVLSIAIGGGAVAGTPTNTVSTTTGTPTNTVTTASVPTNTATTTASVPTNTTTTTASVPTNTVTSTGGASNPGGSGVSQSSPPNPPSAGGIYATRDMSAGTVAPGGNISVTVTVHKGSLAGFAKLEEKIPDGFTASEDTQGKGKGSASFSFVDGKMKMVWLSLPTDSVFTVSYLLNAGASASGSQLVTGKFAYVYNGAASNYQLSGTSFVVTGGSGAIAVTPTNTVNTNPTNTVVTNPTSTVAITNPTTTVTPTTTTDVTPHIGGGSKGVVYHVQIMALHSALSDFKGYFARMNGINEPITPSMEEGFTKYMVGKYTEYKSARDHREEVKAKNVVAPFVVAYNGGQRITVQDALMITKQTWVQ